MSDILFVVPSRKPSFGEEFSGTLLLATILKQKGMSVDIYRFYEANNDNGFFPFVDETVSNILAKSPKIVSFYCRCDCYLANIMIAKKIKESHSDIYIVFGGPQADASSYDTLNEIPWVDFCCRGEGETTVYPLFSALLENKDYTNTDGLSFRDKENGIIENPVAQLVEDLDTLPFIDYSLVPDENIKNSIENNYAAPLDVGRGCPFKCAYCSTSIFWQRKFRLKSSARIISEMQKLNKEFGFTKFTFEHDLFTANKNRVIDFTNALKQSGNDFKWACSSRIDTLDEEAIQAMASYGLTGVYLGIESGSERMQELMNKNLKIDNIINTISTFMKHNVKITASFMYGLPEETDEDIEKTLQLAYKLYKLGVSTFQFHLCSITPGTPYYYKYFDKLSLALNQSDQVGDFGIEECQDFIQDHIKLFSFCYEYKSETRDKFSLLNKYTLETLIIYEKLSALLPDEYSNKKLTDLLLEIIALYSNNSEPKKEAYEIGIDYINSRYDGEKLKKLSAAFSFFRHKSNAFLNKDFTASVEVFPINVSLLKDNTTIDEIPFSDTLVYFNKVNNEIYIKTVKMKK